MAGFAEAARDAEKAFRDSDRSARAALAQAEALHEGLGAVAAAISRLAGPAMVDGARVKVRGADGDRVGFVRIVDGEVFIDASERLWSDL